MSIALVPAMVVFLVVLGALFAAGIGAGMELTRWSPPDWVGIGWPVGFPLFAALVALPVFLMSLGWASIVGRTQRPT
ncbi:MAG: hypothetical protein HY263_06855 [Chloroflexi bacterium]|nr:hypothetical protein [Chloroflexota bacterium]